MEKTTMNPLAGGRPGSNSVWQDPSTGKQFIRVEALPEDLKQYVAAFGDESGRIDAQSLIDAGRKHQERRQSVSFLRTAVILLVVVLVILLGCGAGLTYAMVELSKDTRTDEAGILHTAVDGVMQSTVVKTENPHMVVENGILESRADGQAVVTQSEELRKSRHTMSSEWPNSMLRNLKYIDFGVGDAESPTGARYEAFLLVQSFARVPCNATEHGTDSLVHIYTDLGEVTLVKDQMYLDDELKANLEKIGFPLSTEANGRRLMGEQHINGRKLHFFEAVIVMGLYVAVAGVVLGVYSVGWCVFNCYDLATGGNPSFF